MPHYGLSVLRDASMAAESSSYHKPNQETCHQTWMWLHLPRLLNQDFKHELKSSPDYWCWWWCITFTADKSKYKHPKHKVKWWFTSLKQGGLFKLSAPHSSLPSTLPDCCLRLLPLLFGSLSVNIYHMFLWACLLKSCIFHISVMNVCDSSPVHPWGFDCSPCWILSMLLEHYLYRNCATKNNCITIAIAIILTSSESISKTATDRYTAKCM